MPQGDVVKARKNVSQTSMKGYYEKCSICTPFDLIYPLNFVMMPY